VGRHLVLAIGVLLVVHGSSWAQASDTARDDVLVVPGTPDDYWKAASLAGAAPTGPRFLLEFIRAIEAMEIHDTNRLRSVYEYFNPQRSRSQAGRSFTLPLPLRLSAWSKLVSAGSASDLFSAAMKDRRARRLLYGAAALNPETRQYLEGRTALVERLHRNHSDVFAVLGRSFKVRDGRVDVPGGATAVELWEQVVGAPVSTPDVFVDRLLAADTGELAALYDAVAHLDVAHQRFVLGLWMSDPVKRRARFLTLYRAARAAGRRVAIPHQPFVRTGLDLFTAVSQLRVLDDGRPAPPSAPAFWRPMVQQLDRWPDTEWSGAPDESTVDATWFVEVVMLSTKSIWEQTAIITFAQRLFAAAEASGAASSADRIAYLVRQFTRSPVLALTLERAGVRDIAVYVAAFDRAGALSVRGTNPYWHRQLLTQFQAAVGLVEQLRLTNRIAVPVAERLITSLSRIEPNQERAYGGAVARWVAEQLLPAIGAETTSTEGESLLLAALSGALRDEASMRRLTWEDWDYRINPSIVPLSHLTQIRHLQAGNSLDAVLRVWRAAALVPASRAEELSRGAPDSGALEQVRRAASAVRPLIDAIREPTAPTDGTRRDGPDVKATLRESVAALDGIRDARQLSRVPEIGQRLMKAVDVLTADVLASLLYAIHIREPESPLWLQGDVAYRHDFGLQNRDNLDPDLLSWWFPAEQLGATWHVRGSLLGLDIALARLRLPQVATGGPPALPVMAPEDQRVFIESVTLFDPASVVSGFSRTDDETMQAIGDAIRSGRERVREAARNQQAIDRLAELGHVGEWRRYYVFPWLTANAPDEVLPAFSLTELYRIGLSGRVTAPVGADSWGTSAFSVAGCQCLRIAAPQAWEDVSGRIAVVPTVMSDGTLRLAELLSELKLPAVLARYLLPVLMRDFLDRVQMIYSDDWTAVARYWTTVPRDRIDDAMGQLTVDGPLLAGEARPRR
jgi:hypothetical protein